MTAIIIISAIVLIIVFLLASYVKLELEYDAEAFVKIKYLCFTLFMSPKTRRMLKKEKKKAAREKKKQEKERKKREKLRRKRNKGQHLSKKKPEAAHLAGNEKSCGAKNTAAENRSGEGQNVKVQKTVNAQKEKSEKKEKDKPSLDLQAIVSAVRAAKPYAKRLFKKIRLYDVFSEIIVGGEDAAKTAVSYGIHCAAIDGLVCFLKNTVSLKIKKIDIKANFDLEKTDYYFYGRAKLRLSTLLFCLIWGFFAVTRAAASANKDNKGRTTKKDGSEKVREKAA